jgi:RNA polymerase sigma-70 factor (ECF subfamily)
VTSEEQANLESYARLFNARDWEGLRSLLAAEAQLDLVTRVKRSVVEAKYYDRYAEILRDQTIRAESGWVDGRPAIAMYRPASSTTPTYFLLIAWSHGQITHIRDYYYVPYIASGASFDPR